MRLRFLTATIILPLLLIGSALAQTTITPSPTPPRMIQRNPDPKAQARQEENLMADRARRAEMSGDYARALPIWKEILTRSPWNPEAVQAYPRTLMVLKKYDECAAFLDDYIQKNAFRDLPALVSDPTSPFALKLIRGQLALIQDDSKKAWEIWNAALAETNRQPDAVRALVNMLQQNRLWEDSEKLIREQRKLGKDPAFMSFELALSLRGQMDWTGAAEELLLYADNSPAGWQMAQNYFNQFPADSSVTTKVNAVLRKAVEHDRKNPTLWNLLAGWSHKTGDADEYLRASIVADSLSNGGGTFVLASADQMLKEGDVEPARRGYQKVIAWKPAPDVQAHAELGLGRCLESLGQWNAARQAYEGFLQQHPKFKECDEARFRIADILLNHDHDPAAALTIFQTLWAQNARGFPRTAVGLRVGDCLAWQGKFDSAIVAWRGVVTLTPPLQFADEGTQALLRIARANLWRDSTDRALDALDTVQLGNPMNGGFNDAVLYSTLLGEGGFHGAVRAFADGDYAEFRHDDSTAAKKFDEAATLLKSGKLAEWARYAEAQALRASRQFPTAIAVLDTFVANYAESVDIDRAEYLRSVIRMDDLHDTKTALAEFEEFLIKHPRSIYLEQVRKRARMIGNKVS